MPRAASNVTNADMALFCRQFGSLLHANINILEVLDTLRSQVDKTYLREVIDTVRRDIEMGRTLATAFSRYPQTFSPFFVSMVRQGELEGEMDQVLMTLAEHFESRLGDQVDRTRTGQAGAFDLESLMSALRYIFIWGFAFLSAICICAAAVWIAVNAGAFGGAWLAPAILLTTGIIFLLGVLLFSRRAG
ncbi:MAG: type II secretion system F family protein [Armatimonadota bacterium]|jgi:hypothetical protein